MCNSTYIQGLFMPRKFIKCGWTAKGNEVGSYIFWNVSENWKWVAKSVECLILGMWRM
jgi:hypothetical protein